jgi:cathepsin H
MRLAVAASVFQQTVLAVDPRAAQLVSVHNSDPTSPYTLTADGPFGSTAWEEFQRTVLMAPQDCSATENRKSVTDEISSADLPTHVDWRDQGVVSGVKNQGKCGSCWTFSTSGAMEAHHAIKFKPWRTSEMSEQQLLDCATDFDNHGCQGGLPSHAFEYIHHAGGLSKEFAYAYRAESSGDKNRCRWSGTEANKTALGGRTVSSFNVTEGDEESLKRIVATVGPVSVAFQVVEDFRLYKHGIYSSSKCGSGPKDVNHAVLVVGYGQAPETGRPYWIVKNSWGPEWGEEGYFKIERGKNMCGIATCASYPVLDKDQTSVTYDETPEVITA